MGVSFCARAASCPDASHHDHHHAAVNAASAGPRPGRLMNRHWRDGAVTPSIRQPPEMCKLCTTQCDWAKPGLTFCPGCEPDSWGACRRRPSRSHSHRRFSLETSMTTLTNGKNHYRSGATLAGAPGALVSAPSTLVPTEAISPPRPSLVSVRPNSQRGTARTAEGAPRQVPSAHRGRAELRSSHGSGRFLPGSGGPFMAITPR